MVPRSIMTQGNSISTDEITPILLFSIYLPELQTYPSSENNVIHRLLHRY